MSQEKANVGILDSKPWKAFLVVIAVLFVFGGAYLAYAFIHILKMDFVVSMASGFVLFIAGLAFMWYLIRNKVIS